MHPKERERERERERGRERERDRERDGDKEREMEMEGVCVGASSGGLPVIALILIISGGVRSSGPSDVCTPV